MEIKLCRKRLLTSHAWHGYSLGRLWGNTGTSIVKLKFMLNRWTLRNVRRAQAGGAVLTVKIGLRVEAFSPGFARCSQYFAFQLRRQVYLCVNCIKHRRPHSIKFLAPQILPNIFCCVCNILNPLLRIWKCNYTRSFMLDVFIYITDTTIAVCYRFKEDRAKLWHILI